MVHFLQNDWAEVLDEEFEKPYYKELREFLKHAYASERVYPPMEDIYNALRVTPYASTKVVILGQDPYHGLGQAHGLSFFRASRCAAAAIAFEYFQRNGERHRLRTSKPTAVSSAGLSRVCSS